MGGKHRREAGAAGPGAATFIAWAVALLLVAGGVVVVRALLSVGSDQVAGGGSTPTTTSSAPAVTTPASPSATTDAAGSLTVEAATVSAMLASCRAEVRAQESLRKAGEASYRDWSGHVGAQLGLDDGSLTVPAARAQWAATKARGPADVAAFAKASAAVKKAGDGCGPLARLELPDGIADQSAVQRCIARSQVLRPLLKAAAAVHADWAEHVQMMKSKASTPHEEYAQRWLRMVKDARSPLNSYKSAAGKAAKTPGCPA